jgi:hypothetical protein
MGPHPVSPFGEPSNTIPPPPPAPTSGLKFPPDPVPEHAAKLSPQHWQETFKDPNWLYNDTKETSQSRPSEATKRLKASQKASAPQIGTSKAQDELEASRPKNRAFTEEPENGEPDAMDINSRPPPVKKGTRTVLTLQKLNTTAGIGVIPNGSATAPSSATTAKPPGGGLKGIDSDSRKLLVEPQTNGTSGLASVDDALPFQSQASNSHPVKSHAAQSLKFPQIPARASKQHDSANTGFLKEDVILVTRLPVPTEDLDVLTSSDAFIQYTEDEIDQAGDYTLSETKDTAPPILPDKRDDPSHYKSLEKPHDTAIVLQQKYTLQDPIFALSLPLLVDKILRYLPLPILEPIVSPGKVRVYWTPVCCSVQSV